MYIWKFIIFCNKYTVQFIYSVVHSQNPEVMRYTVVLAFKPNSSNITYKILSKQEKVCVRWVRKRVILEIQNASIKNVDTDDAKIA